MPTSTPGSAVRWRTLKTRDGRTLQVAIVRKGGPRPEGTAHHPKSAKKKGK